MQDFVKSLRFKILVGVLTVMLGFMIMAVYSGGSASLFSRIVSIVTVPVQQFSAGVSGGISGFFDKFIMAGQTYDQNIALQKELDEMRQKLVDYEKIKNENKQFREIIGMEKTHRDQSLETAAVIARDPADRFGSFTIDKGSLDGVKIQDPVKTASGLVGYISEVGITSSKVVTLLDPKMAVGCYDSTTRDIGIVSGSVAHSLAGLCRMEYIPRESTAKAGDIILTSGGSLFPKDIVVGTIEKLEPSSSGTSLIATIKLATDPKKVKEVFVITRFEGQGQN